MTNSMLRQALLNKLSITPQGLSLRIQKLKKIHSITTEDATYVIAQQNGIILDKYLEKMIVDRIRILLRDISTGSQSTYHDQKTPKKEITKKENRREIIISKEFKETDPILPAKKLLEAKEMAALYPLLYVFENSVREVIDKVISQCHGDIWYEKGLTASLEKTIKDRMDNEKKNSWHQRRGSRPIDYVDLNQLKPLVSKYESLFVPSIIPSLEWFSQLIDEMYQSRCVLCHMNPLHKDNISSVTLRYKQWQKQIRHKKI